MRLSAEVRYPADVATVAAMLSDPAFIDAKLRDAGATPGHVTVTPGAGGLTTIAVRSLIPTAAIPAHIRSFVGAHLDVRQVEVWEDASAGARRATVAVEIIGAPVRMTGTITLIPHEDGGCVETFAGLVKASLRLFAGTVEDATAVAFHDAVAAEERVSRDWLAKH